MTVRIVTTNADSGDGSLRDAILAAEAGDVIEFDESLRGTTVLLSSALVPSVPLTIRGLRSADSGLAEVTIDGAGRVRVFAVAAAVALTLEDLVVANGKSTSPGGGLQFARATAHVDATNVLFSSNVARQGAAVYGWGTFTSCDFVNNSTTGTAGVDSNASGGAVCNPYATASTFVGCCFEGNVSSGSGGAFYASPSGSNGFTSCEFLDNTAATGGAIAASAALENCAFSYNSAADPTSSAVSARSSATFKSCVFDVAQNVATGSGTILGFDGPLVFRGLTLATGSTLSFFADCSVAFWSLSVAGSAYSSGSGLLAVPPGVDVSALTLPATVEVATLGAGASEFSARSVGTSVALTWKTKQARDVLLQRLDGGAWSTVSTTARSPQEVEVATRTTFRIWDGETFQTVDAVLIQSHAWTVYANAVALDISSAFNIVTAFIMMSTYSNRGETPIFFARIEDSATTHPLDVSTVASASYSVFKTSYAWGSETRTPVDGHQDVPVPLSAFLSELVTGDPRWTQDSAGYNFIFEPDATGTPLFAAPGSYVVVVTVNFTTGNPAPISYNVAVN